MYSSLDLRSRPKRFAGETAETFLKQEVSRKKNF